MKPVKSKIWNEEVRAELDELWRTMEITDLRRFERDAARARLNRPRYASVGSTSGGTIPWWFVACVHNLEASFSFAKHLHNGDSLARRTVHVPAGRPLEGEPPFAWSESARDALTMPGKRFHLVTDWSVEHALWLLEGFNGYGYRLYRGINSPYLWAGTNHYSKGKYVADGVYSAEAVSQQAGVAGLMKILVGGKCSC